MTLRIEVAANAAATSWTNITSLIDLSTAKWGGEAFRGSVGTGAGFDLRDDAATTELKARRVVRVVEDAPGHDVVMFRGRIAEQGVNRGPRFDGDTRQFDVQLNDINGDLGGIIVQNYDRSLETDVARIRAVWTDYLKGTSSGKAARARPSTSFTDDYIADANTTQIASQTYNGTPADVVQDVLDWVDKEFFITFEEQLFYDLATSTAFAADLAITDENADSSATFAPAPEGDAGHRDGTDLISGIKVTWNGSGSYYTNDPATEATYDKWEITKALPTANADKAAAWARKILARQKTEEQRYQCVLTLRASQVDKIKPGQTLSFRWAAAGVLDDVTVRVARLMWNVIGWGPNGPDEYEAHLELGLPKKGGSSIPGGGGPPTVAWVPCPPASDAHIYTFDHSAMSDDPATAIATEDAGGLLEPSTTYRIHFQVTKSNPRDYAPNIGLETDAMHTAGHNEAWWAGSDAIAQAWMDANLYQGSAGGTYDSTFTTPDVAHFDRTQAVHIGIEMAAEVHVPAGVRIAGYIDPIDPATAADECPPPAVGQPFSEEFAGDCSTTVFQAGFPYSGIQSAFVDDGQGHRVAVTLEQTDPEHGVFTAPFAPCNLVTEKVPLTGFDVAAGQYRILTDAVGRVLTGNVVTNTAGGKLVVTFLGAGQGSTGVTNPQPTPEPPASDPPPVDAPAVGFWFPNAASTITENGGDLADYIAAEAGAGHVIGIRPGTYRVSQTFVSGVDDITIVGTGVVLRRVTGTAGGGAIFKFWSAHRLAIYGLIVEGPATSADVASVPPSFGRQDEHAFELVDVHAYTLSGVAGRKVFGDGLYLARIGAGATSTLCEDGLVDSSRFVTSGRNGISLISARRLVVRNTELDDCSLHGFDVEGNASDDVCEDVLIQGGRSTNFGRGTASHGLDGYAFQVTPGFNGVVSKRFTVDGLAMDRAQIKVTGPSSGSPAQDVTLKNSTASAGGSSVLAHVHNWVNSSNTGLSGLPASGDIS